MNNNLNNNNMNNNLSNNANQQNMQNQANAQNQYSNNIQNNMQDSLQNQFTAQNGLNAQNNNYANPAMNTFDQIPQANNNAASVTAQITNSGHVTGYQLSNGATVTTDQAVNMAKSGEIAGVGVAHNKGKQYIKSLPDSSASNNLGNLPRIEQ